MPGFDGTGPRGMGPMTGGGRGYCSPWGIGRAYGRSGGMPYGPPYGAAPYGAPYSGGAMPYGPQMNREQELDLLRQQAETVKEQLAQIEKRVRELSDQE